MAEINHLSDYRTEGRLKSTTTRVSRFTWNQGDRPICRTPGGLFDFRTVGLSGGIAERIPLRQGIAPEHQDDEYQQNNNRRIGEDCE